MASITLKEIKRNYKIPVIMLSSLTGTDTTIEALQLGAEDFIENLKILILILPTLNQN